MSCSTWIRICLLCAALEVTAAVAMGGDETEIGYKALLRDCRVLANSGVHNAFADLTRFNGEWFCVYRVGTEHASPNGVLHVISSSDGQTWQGRAVLKSPFPDLPDLRDPKICITPDRQLMIMAGAIDLSKGSLRTVASFSRDGTYFSTPLAIGDKNCWLWDIVWKSGTAYSMSYASTGERKTRLSLYRSYDGKDWSLVRDNLFPEDEEPTEAALACLPDGDMVAVVRTDRGRKGGAYFGKAHAPYVDWAWKPLYQSLGGPTMLQTGGRVLVGSRFYTGPNSPGRKRYTGLAWLDLKSGYLAEFLMLPSGIKGAWDCGYPGLFLETNLLRVVYNSDHESQVMVYIAEVDLSIPPFAGLRDGADWRDTAPSAPNARYANSAAVRVGTKDGAHDLVIGGRNNIVRAFRGGGKLALRPFMEKSGTNQPGGFGCFGTCMAIGDFNGDQAADLVVGANWVGIEGKLYLYSGQANDWSQSPIWTLTGKQCGSNYAHLGSSPLVTGDFNGDGYEDLAFSVQNMGTQPKEWTGDVLAFYGSSQGLRADRRPDWKWAGHQNECFFGGAMAVGDVNGDGFDDLAAGASQFDGAALDCGQVSLFLGARTGLQSEPAWVRTGQFESAEFGSSVATGDVDGDRCDDLLVGSEGYGLCAPAGGKVELYCGGPEGLHANVSWAICGEQEGGRMGSSVALADVNGDARADAIVGEHGYDTLVQGGGRVRVFIGSRRGLPLDPDWTSEGMQTFEHRGDMIVAGDFDGDGKADLVFLEPYYDVGPVADAGAAFVCYGARISQESLAQRPPWLETLWKFMDVRRQPSADSKPASGGGKR